MLSYYVCVWGSSSALGWNALAGFMVTLGQCPLPIPWSASIFSCVKSYKYYVSVNSGSTTRVALPMLQKPIAAHIFDHGQKLGPGGQNKRRKQAALDDVFNTVPNL